MGSKNGFGSYGYEPNLNTFFGITRGIRTGGIGVNMLFSMTAESHNGDAQARNQLRFQAGLISSSLEHAVPEQMFSDPDNPTQGFSAVRALEIAAQQGQRIYQFDQDNINQVMPQLNLDFSVEAEIRDSVRAGRIVVTHTDNVSVPGYSGAGYLVLDPDTLIGAYKISGGGNGGFFVILGFTFLLISLIASLGLLLAATGFAIIIPLLTTVFFGYQFFIGFGNFLNELASSNLSQDEMLEVLSRRVFLLFLSALSSGVLGTAIGRTGGAVDPNAGPLILAKAFITSVVVMFSGFVQL